MCLLRRLKMSPSLGIIGSFAILQPRIVGLSCARAPSGAMFCAVSRSFFASLSASRHTSPFAAASRRRVENPSPLHVHRHGDKLKMAIVAREAAVAHPRHPIPVLHRRIGALDADANARRRLVEPSLPIRLSRCRVSPYRRSCRRCPCRSKPCVALCCHRPCRRNRPARRPGSSPRRAGCRADRRWSFPPGARCRSLRPRPDAPCSRSRSRRSSW